MNYIFLKLFFLLFFLAKKILKIMYEDVYLEMYTLRGFYYSKHDSNLWKITLEKKI